ncbi:hypothetical protein EMCRGX_G023836 [Ephydatia muelleri]
MQHTEQHFPTAYLASLCASKISAELQRTCNAELTKLERNSIGITFSHTSGSRRAGCSMREVSTCCQIKAFSSVSPREAVWTTYIPQTCPVVILIQKGTYLFDLVSVDLVVSLNRNSPMKKQRE